MTEFERDSLAVWIGELWPQAQKAQVTFVGKQLLPFDKTVVEAAIHEHRGLFDFLNPTELLAGIRNRSMGFAGSGKARWAPMAEAADQRRREREAERVVVEKDWERTDAMIAALRDEQVQKLRDRAVQDVAEGSFRDRLAALPVSAARNSRCLKAMMAQYLG